MAAPPLSQLPKFLYRQLLVTPQIPPETTFTGQVAIVTGSNIGLGFEAAQHITRLGAAKVILAVRSAEKGEAAKTNIEESTGRQGVVEVWNLDLQSYDSVKAFAKRAQQLNRLDVLIKNAAVATETWRLAEGHESTITTNVISTFLLALLLMPKLRETAVTFHTRSHLTVITSDVHCFTPFEEQRSEHIFETLRTEKGARMAGGERYSVSKLLEVLVLREWASPSGPMGPEYPVILNLVNPGYCYSALTREVVGLLAFIIWLSKVLFARSTECGSRTLVQAATAKEETHGQYLSECQVTDTADLTQGEQGAQLGRRVWGELSDILEGIEPGVTRNF